MAGKPDDLTALGGQLRLDRARRDAHFDRMKVRISKPRRIDTANEGATV